MTERIRSLDPMAGLRATFILGFPGEEDEDAREVEAFVSEQDLDWIGVFTYSREPGTRSHDMPGEVHEAVARGRSEAVAAAADDAMSRRAAALAGAGIEVMIERFDREDGLWKGRSHREAPEIDGEITLLDAEGVSVGDYVAAQVTSNDGTDLAARVSS
jgi:tRNA A37 methylthiotransferase MiaB